MAQRQKEIWKAHKKLEFYEMEKEKFEEKRLLESGEGNIWAVSRRS